MHKNYVVDFNYKSEGWYSGDISINDQSSNINSNPDLVRPTIKYKNYFYSLNQNNKNIIINNNNNINLFINEIKRFNYTFFFISRNFK